MTPTETVSAETALQAKALTWKEKAVACKVTNQVTYDQAVELLRGIKDLRGEAERHHRPVIESAHQTHKLACAALNAVDKPLAEAEALLKGSIGDFAREQERIQRQLDEEARQAAIRKQEEERLAAAYAFEEAGASKEEVNAVLDEPLAEPIAKAAPVYQRSVSIPVTPKYSAEVVSLMTLVKAIAEGKAPIQAVKADESFLNIQARALKTAFSMPGVRLKEGSTVSVR